MRAKFATLGFDAVIAESSSATRFLLSHPGLFAPAQRYAIDPIGSEIENNQSDVHLIAAQGDWARKALPAVTEVMPNLKRIIAVVDHSPVGESNKRSLLAALPTLPPSVTLDVWDDFSFDELFQRAALLAPDSAILYSPVFQDRLGAHQTPRLTVQDLVKVSAAPVFAHHDTFLGTGIVGGRLLSSRREGHMIADLALGRADAKEWENAETLLNPYIFDDAALRRWGITVDRLPTSYSLTGRSEPVWFQYRWQIGMTLAALILEGLLILWLVTALKQRKAAISAVVRERDGLERRVAERTGDLLAATSRLEESNARLEALASTDPLTAIPNRRKFLDVAESTLRDAQAAGRPLSFLMLDIDRFKSINDRYGHAAGDEVIRTMARTCQGQIKATDCVGRMGGEEFAILLTDTDAPEAAIDAERIRTVARSTLIVLDDQRDVTITVSIGISALRGDDDTLKDLMARADAALYSAKNGGRDRVVGASEAQGSPQATAGAISA